MSLSGHWGGCLGSEITYFGKSGLAGMILSRFAGASLGGTDADFRTSLSARPPIPLAKFLSLRAPNPPDAS